LNASADTPPLHNGPFLDAVSEHTLRLQRCTACGCVPSYPRIACPRCFEPLGWFEPSGAGRIVSFSVLQRTHAEKYARHLPIVLVRVELEEDGEMISTLIGDDRLDVQIGASVVYAGSCGWSTLPQFTLDRTRRPLGSR
jgi:uncharacterized OB-fold protein